MTTKVTIDVNGRYRATVVHKNMTDGSVLETRVVEGRYDGSPNPTGTSDFWLRHPANNVFEVTEEYIGDASAAEAQPTAG